VRAAAAAGGTDYKTRLQERAQAQRLQPRYAVVGTEGPDHDKTFEVALYLGERELARARGKSKKEAEQRAAERGLAVLEADAAGPSSS
jgi:ribonuclease-3